MTDQTTPERVSIASTDAGAVRLARREPLGAVDAIEPGFYRDPFDGQVYSMRKASRPWWRRVADHVRVR